MMALCDLRLDVFLLLGFLVLRFDESPALVAGDGILFDCFGMDVDFMDREIAANDGNILIESVLTLSCVDD